MWPRVVELMLGLWLAVSPFVFRHAPDETWLWLNDLACAGLVVTLSLLSYSGPARLAHLATAVVGVWLMALGRFGGMDPAFQNHFTVGLLLAMHAIIPNHASAPPRSWRDLAESGRDALPSAPEQRKPGIGIHR